MPALYTSWSSMSSIPSGHSVHSIIGDGNCMFRALSFVMHGTQDHHVEIRREVVSHVVNNWAHFGKFIVGDSSYGPTLRNAGEYVRHMSRSGAQGGHVELVAAANVLHVDIDVHSARGGSGRVIRIPASGGGRRQVALLYSGSGDSGHYEAIVASGTRR